MPIAFALVATIGLLMGSFLPRGIEQLKGEAPELVPWAWGINGVFFRPRPGLRHRLFGHLGHRGAAPGRHSGLPRRGVGAAAHLDPERPLVHPSVSLRNAAITTHADDRQVRTVDAPLRHSALPDARRAEVRNEVYDRFIDLDATEDRPLRRRRGGHRDDRALRPR